MNLTPTHILQLGVIPTQKVKDALTAWLYCRYMYLLLSLSLYLRLMYLLHTATFRASECDEKALKGLIIMCCMQSSGLTFCFWGYSVWFLTLMREDACIFGQTDLLRYVLSWLGLGLTCQEISISREWK